MKLTPITLPGVVLERGLETEALGRPQPPEPMPPTQTLSALKLELARRQLDLVSAQAYIKEAITTVARQRTDPKLELEIDALLRDPARASDVPKLLGAAFEAGGVPALATALAIFEAQCAAWFEIKSEQPRIGALLDAVVARALALLGEAPAATDHSAAMASMVAANRALGCGRSFYAAYTTIDSPVASCDAFSNEPGFPDLAAKVDVKGGAVVGVSGALLELGSRGAELVVSVDANPSIQKIMLLFSGLLLAVDKAAQARGSNEAQQAEAFMASLTRGASPQTIEDLRAIGFPAEMLGEVPAQLDALKSMLAGGSIRGWAMPSTVWCKGPDAAKHIQHLTRLALEGKIIAVSADLADTEVVSRINRVLDMHGVTAKAFHFSNALDYIPNVKGTFRNFEQVHRAPTAVITTTAYFVRDAGERLRQTELTHAMGTLEHPAALKASEWFGARGDQLHDLLWSDPSHRRRLTSDTYSRMGKFTQQTPDSYEAYVKMVEVDRPR